ncbi:phage protein NinX family protein [Paraburkholderia sacchari]|uniref:phage protein NinX family protein n=1 Tax=Paraburkholderia sacchari TaxID=159450 RepID=UPI003D977192
MKTKDLSGNNLNYWVSRALQTPPNRGRAFEPVSKEEFHKPGDFPEPHIPGAIPDYSTDWDAAGTVLDRVSEGAHGFVMSGERGRYEARIGSIWQRGETPLVAFMRAFVGSVYGEEFS